MMINGPTRMFRAAVVGSVAAMTLLFAASARAQTPASPAPPSIEIYGFGMADAIADFNQVNPDWYDSARPSRLPAFKDQFGNDGRFSLSARQSRFGVRASSNDVKVQFEFDLYGTGKDAGLTTMRMRHAFGQWKRVGAGMTNSAFMDIDVFPNTLEYWGPNGMLFLRTAQVFFDLPLKGGSSARIALENPGASGDAGVYADRVELQNVKPRFPSPDYTGHYRYTGKNGYLQFGGILRYLAYDDLIPNDAFDLNGHVWGWGVSVSSNIKVTPNDTLRLQFNEGAGIENYFNDAPIDVGVENVTAPTNPIAGTVTTPVKGRALPDKGFVAYLDHNWTKMWSTAIGYSRVDIDNSNGQTPDAYKNGQYISGNLLYAPLSNVLMGGEYIWIRRENHSDGFGVSDNRIQFSFKYSFSHKIGG